MKHDGMSLTLLIFCGRRCHPLLSAQVFKFYIMPGRLPIRHSIAIIGPPGSGKGSYGRLLAEWLSIPLVTVSTLLKQAQLDTSSGKLVDDETVSGILSERLPLQPYLLDGFPRTLNQVKLMERDWPIPPIKAAISLEVPRQVCLEKLLGRRVCTVCNLNWNVADVQYGQFDLPASLPVTCSRCSPSDDWVQRLDDDPTIVQGRLDTFYERALPILEHYEQNGMLLRFTPYLGYRDMPRFQLAVTKWNEEFEVRC
jgi:adenylate kinase